MCLADIEIDHFFDQLLPALQNIANYNGLQGVFQAVGPPDPALGTPYAHEGRVAQYQEEIDALLARAGTLIELERSEWRYFPKGLPQGPIRYVVPLRI